MTFQQVMNTLESLGTAQNRKVYARHGAGENVFGVSFANLNKLKKTIKTDHALAQQLWETGNADARILATMIADPDKTTAQDLNQWLGGIRYYVLADLFAAYVSKTRFARMKMEAWTKSKQEFPSQVGWDLLTYLAMANPELPDAYFEKYLKVIEGSIHQAKNRTKHAMNQALIAIGVRNRRLRKLALAAAARIGKVEVDHGETNCKTPDAATYIKKTAAYRRSRPAKRASPAGSA